MLQQPGFSGSLRVDDRGGVTRPYTVPPGILDTPGT